MWGLGQVPEVDTAIRSLTINWDGGLIVAANNNGTCYVWRLLKGAQVPYPPPLPHLPPTHSPAPHTQRVINACSTRAQRVREALLSSASSDMGRLT